MTSKSVGSPNLRMVSKSKSYFQWLPRAVHTQFRFYFCSLQISFFIPFSMVCHHSRWKRPVRPAYLSTFLVVRMTHEMIHISHDQHNCNVTRSEPWKTGLSIYRNLHHVRKPVPIFSGVEKERKLSAVFPQSSIIVIHVLYHENKNKAWSNVTMRQSIRFCWTHPRLWAFLSVGQLPVPS